MMIRSRIQLDTVGVPRFLAYLLLVFALCTTGALSSPSSSRRAESLWTGKPEYDIVIYGATPAAITAALQTTRMGKKVAIIAPGEHIGGLTTSGVGWTDSKNGDAIGGIAREFYQEVYNYYKDERRWFEVTREVYVDEDIKAQPGRAVDDAKQVQWTFEPHVAEGIFEAWMRNAKVPIFRNERIDRSGNGVTKKDGRITSIRTESGKTFSAFIFIDAGYDGDMMAEAGIPNRVGRESNAAYHETYEGIQINNNTKYAGIDPYKTKKQPDSGLLSGITRTITDYLHLNGTADPNRLQSYCYRVSLTLDERIRKPFNKPDGYDEGQYELLLRYIEAGYKGPFFTNQTMPNLKTDTNAAGEVSTDLMGGNFDDKAGTNYVDDSYEEREAIALKHKVYEQGFFWTLANHPRVPEIIRHNVSRYGYVNDEWSSNGNWPYEIYIREARRMAGVYTMTQADVQAAQPYANDSVVGLGSYNLDVHQQERVVIDGRIYDEGLVHVPNPTPYTIPYGCMVPRAGDAINFLNPVTVSSTHVAFGSLRTEPTYMILGQSAATAAVMALMDGVAVQDVDRGKLSSRLGRDKQRLTWPL